jgi:hypothetical protein
MKSQRVPANSRPAPSRRFKPNGLGSASGGDWVCVRAGVNIFRLASSFESGPEIKPEKPGRGEGRLPRRTCDDESVLSAKRGVKLSSNGMGRL